MRLMAFSDLHLDAPFARGGAKLAALRRSHLRDALAEIARLALDEGVDALLCAGDLFEHERSTPDTATLLSRVFGELAPLAVLLAPGNHDWFGPSSIYAGTDWSPNVHLFTTEHLRPFDLTEGVRIWGAAHLAPSGTSGFVDGFAVEGEALHIGLFHGSELGGWARETEPDKIQHAPFRSAQIQASGLAHAIVGHHHTPVDGEWHTYPGCPVPLAFGGRQDGGAVVLEFGAEGLVDRRRHRVSTLDAHELTLRLDDVGDSGRLEHLVDEAVAGLRGVARLTLEGEIDPGLVVEPEVLAARTGSLVDLQVRVGDLRPGYDLDAVALEPTVRGQFVRDVLAAGLEQSEQQRVLLTGLRALDGRDDLEVA